MLYFSKIDYSNEFTYNLYITALLAAIVFTCSIVVSAIINV
jgi:hypothetical protein